MKSKHNTTCHPAQQSIQREPVSQGQRSQSSWWRGGRRVLKVCLRAAGITTFVCVCVCFFLFDFTFPLSDIYGLSQAWHHSGVEQCFNKHTHKFAWFGGFFSYFVLGHPNHTTLKACFMSEIWCEESFAAVGNRNSFYASVLTVNYIFISTSNIFIDLQIKALSANFSLASFIYTFEH